jgi:hypothetical protein
VLSPVEAEVDSEDTLLFVVLRPVDNEVIEVDSDDTLLLVVLRPVDVDVDRLLR